jgi:phosphoribosylformylglycinamidine synthase subunit PurQ / glutaminase
MAPVKVLILRTAGTNCDHETEFAWQLAGATAERVHLSRVIAEPRLLDDYQILTLPGGFSFGDDISAGRVFARQLERHLRDQLGTFVDAGKLVLGICNGFQVLVKAGLLPERNPTSRRCTIAANEPPGFQDRWVWLEAGDTPCAFLEPHRRYELPIAHGEGRVTFSSPADRNQVTQQRLAALRYVAPENPAGHAGLPPNPNGSDGDLAGLCDSTGRVLGLMPHPERFVRWTQHPAWTSLPPREPGDGFAFFEQAVRYFR